MNNIEKQLLENQLVIMSKIGLVESKEFCNTHKLLNPERDLLESCNMSDLNKMDALVNNGEKK